MPSFVLRDELEKNFELKQKHVGPPKFYFGGFIEGWPLTRRVQVRSPPMVDATRQLKDGSRLEGLVIFPLLGLLCDTT